MGLFGFGKSAAEKRLIETYSVGLQWKFGPDARKVAKEWVEMARKQAEAAGTLNIENAYATYLHFAESNAEAKRRLSAKRDDGVTEEDLRLWWNLHELDRLMVEIDDDNSRIAFFECKRESGASGKEAAAEMRKVMPIYGDPLDTERASGDDRPLPKELRDRVNRWLEKKAATGDVEERRPLAKGFSSFNALIRSEIRAGRA